MPHHVCDWSTHTSPSGMQWNWDVSEEREPERHRLAFFSISRAFLAGDEIKPHPEVFVIITEPFLLSGAVPALPDRRVLRDERGGDAMFPGTCAALHLAVAFTSSAEC